MNTASNHSIYAQWNPNTYTVTFNRTNFGNGEVVYFNPVTAKVCDASEAVSTTGTKTGCMKWYAFLDEGGSTIKLLLDHNTTAKIAWNTDSTGTTPVTALAQLSSDVSSWNSTIKSTARLISATEVNRIAPTRIDWNITKTSTHYYLHTGTIYENGGEYIGTAGSNNYAWLFDNTYTCEKYGCNKTDNDTYGYWTSDFSSTNNAWYIGFGGDLRTTIISNNTHHGIRPVIEINKSLVNNTKEVTFNSTYGNLPQLSRPGYTFNGWYTTGGVKIASTTIMNTASNQTLYAQWIQKNYVVTFNRTNYSNGEVVYFNPVTAKVCNANEAVSKSGTNDGCMKWYAFLDNGGETINLLSSNDTTPLSRWNESTSSATASTVLTQLSADTANWNNSIKSTVRLITTDEIIQITNPTISFAQNDRNTSFALHTGNKSEYYSTAGSNKYAWLFDNTYDCTNYGCNVIDPVRLSWGYWTADSVSNGVTWAIFRSGWLSSFASTDKYGVRPVITVNKKSLIETKTITYDSEYGELPNLKSQNYIFQGWYTTGGIKVDSNTIVKFNNNHTLYPQWISGVTNFVYTASSQEYIVPKTGRYKIELWGAQGGNSGGFGGYTSGTIKLDANTSIYIYVGGKGSKSTRRVLEYVGGGYNGGGYTMGQDCCDTGARFFGTGGGATDVRLVSGEADNFEGLKSRIMVAAGGGGTYTVESVVQSSGGAGGGLTGYKATDTDYCAGEGATQTEGGRVSTTGKYCTSEHINYTAPGVVTGSFGIGGHHGEGNNASTGGGGGYYGGSSSGHIAAAGGGSSFISGHDGCNAILETSIKNNMIHSNQSKHYSGYYFTDTLMIDGNGYNWSTTKGEQIVMPNIDRSYYALGIGHSGDGYARITYLGE